MATPPPNHPPSSRGPTDWGICWSCQHRIGSASAVLIDDEKPPLPVCRGCWEQIPIGQRLMVAQRLAATDMQNAALDMLCRALGNAIDDHNLPPWSKRN